jgi:hypothetical protein
MKIREGGMEHEAGNPHCPACTQETYGTPLADAYGFPLPHQCGKGLQHSEWSGGESAVVYFCDHCDADRLLP